MSYPVENPPGDPFRPARALARTPSKRGGEASPGKRTPPRKTHKSEMERMMELQKRAVGKERANAEASSHCPTPPAGAKGSIPKRNDASPTVYEDVASEDCSKGASTHRRNHDQANPEVTSNRDISSEHERRTSMPPPPPSFVHHHDNHHAYKGGLEGTDSQNMANGSELEEGIEPKDQEEERGQEAEADDENDGDHNGTFHPAAEGGKWVETDEPDFDEQNGDGGINETAMRFNKEAQEMRERADTLARKTAKLADTHTQANLTAAARELDAVILVTSKIAEACAGKSDEWIGPYPWYHPNTSGNTTSYLHAFGRKKTPPWLLSDRGVSAFPDVESKHVQAAEEPNLAIVPMGDNDNEGATDSSRETSAERTSDIREDQIGSKEQVAEAAKEQEWPGEVGIAQRCLPIARLHGRRGVLAAGFDQQNGRSIDSCTVVSLDGFPCVRSWRNPISRLHAVSEPLRKVEAATFAHGSLFAATDEGKLARISPEDGAIQAEVDLGPGTVTSLSAVVDGESHHETSVKVAVAGEGNDVRVLLSDSRGLAFLCSFTVPCARRVEDVHLLSAKRTGAPVLATASDVGIHSFSLGPLRRPDCLTSEPSSAVCGHLETGMCVRGFVSSLKIVDAACVARCLPGG